MAWYEGPVDRAGRIATGLLGGVWQVGGFVVDLATAAGNDHEDFNGFWNTLSGRAATRAGLAAEQTIGPDQGLGALIGGLPTQIRNPARQTFEGLELLGQQTIRRPAATAQVLTNERFGGTMMSSAASVIPLLWPAALIGRSPDEVRDAWAATEHISVGQALAFNLAEVDLFDDKARTEFMGSDWFSYQSGLIDASFRLFAEPDIVLGKVGTAARARVAARALRSDDVMDAAYRAMDDLATDFPGAGLADDAPPMSAASSADVTPVDAAGRPTSTPHGAPATYLGGPRSRAVDDLDVSLAERVSVDEAGNPIDLLLDTRGQALEDVPTHQLHRREWDRLKRPEGAVASDYDDAVEAALEAGEDVPARVILQRDDWTMKHMPGRIVATAGDRQQMTLLGRATAARMRSRLSEKWATAGQGEVVNRFDAAVEKLAEATTDAQAADAVADMARVYDGWAESADARGLLSTLYDQAGAVAAARLPANIDIPGLPLRNLHERSLTSVLDDVRAAMVERIGTVTDEAALRARDLTIDRALAEARLAHRQAVMARLRRGHSVPDSTLSSYTGDGGVARARRRQLAHVHDAGPGAGLGDELDEGAGMFVPDESRLFADDGPPGGAGRVEVFGNEVDDQTAWLAGRFRDLYFPDHSKGADLSYLLARGYQAGPDTFRSVWKLASGDMSARVALDRNHELLSARVQRMFDHDGLIDASTDITDRAFADVARLSLSDDAVAAADALPEEMLLELGDRMKASWNQLREVPAVFVSEAAETGLERVVSAAPVASFRERRVRSELWQSGGIGGRAVRTFFNMRPHHLVDLNSQMADVQVSRMLRDSGMDVDEIATWRGRFQGAYGVSARGQVLEEAEQAAWRKMASRFDSVSEEDVEKIAAQISKGRLQARDVIDKRAVYDGERRAFVHLADGAGEIQMPLMRTQTRNVHPLQDFKKVEEALKRYDEKLKRFASTREGLAAARDATSYMLDGVANLWSAAVLLRPGWTFRVVVLDEQLRKAAKMSALVDGLSAARFQVEDFRAGAHNLTHDYMARLGLTGDAGIGKAGVVGMTSGAAVGGAVAGLPGAVVGGLAGGGMLRRMAQWDELRRPQLTINGYTVNAAFGNPGDEAEVYRRLVSSRNDFTEFISRYEDDAAARLMQSEGGWDTIAPEDANYSTAWSWAVNKQIGQDGITLGGTFHDGPARRLMRGETLDDVADWLTSSREGRAYLRDIQPLRRHRIDDWLISLDDHVSSYTAGYDEGIVNRILDGSGARYKDLVDATGGRNMPPVHGQATEQMLGKGPLQRMVNDKIQSMFTALGSMPSDRLSRFPTFERFYEAEMYRLLDDVPPGLLDESTIRQLEGNARQFALAETQDLMYDLAERSEFGEMVRVLMPFYSAWQEVITRWAGLAVDNPVFVSRMTKIWNAPESAGWVYVDDQGDEHIVTRIPEWAKPLLDASPLLENAVDSQGQVRVPKEGFNMLAQGLPGFGPFVQLPLAKLIEAAPSTERAFEWMFPFGAPRNTFEAFAPAWFKRATSYRRGLDDRAYQSAYMRIMQSRLVKMDEGLDDEFTSSQSMTEEDWERLNDQIADETNAFFALRTVANFVAPVSPIFDSPYVQYIDAYRSLRDTEGVEDADAAFLSEYGEEFFWITRSFSRTNDGVSATLEAGEARDRYEDLIERHPDIGGLIIGSEGVGAQVEFSGAMYDRQLSTPVEPGGRQMQRERLMPGEFAEQGLAAAGWAAFTRAMDVIDAARIDAGLPNLQVAAAKPLAAAKAAIINQMAVDHPEWWREFSQTDRSRWNDRIAGMWEASTDERLTQRPDMAALRRYLEAREVVLAELARREAQGGASTLTATANRDLAAAWETLVNGMVEQDLVFGEVYHRWLERDPMTLDLRRDVLKPLGSA